MKQILPVALIAVAATLLGSCSKDYTCTCTVTTAGRSHVVYDNIGQVSKGEAQKQCERTDAIYTDSTNAVNADCHL